VGNKKLSLKQNISASVSTFFEVITSVTLELEHFKISANLKTLSKQFKPFGKQMTVKICNSLKRQ
jgi:hypothetical protein